MSVCYDAIAQPVFGLHVRLAARKAQLAPVLSWQPGLFFVLRLATLPCGFCLKLAPQRDVLQRGLTFYTALPRQGDVARLRRYSTIYRGVWGLVEAPGHYHGPGLVAWPPGVRACRPWLWDQVDFETATPRVRRVKKGTPATHPVLGHELRALGSMASRSQSRLSSSPPNAVRLTSNRAGYERILPHARRRWREAVLFRSARCRLRCRRQKLARGSWRAIAWLQSWTPTSDGRKYR
jgi:hypothetical protein